MPDGCPRDTINNVRAVLYFLRDHEVDPENPVSEHHSSGRTLILEALSDALEHATAELDREAQ